MAKEKYKIRLSELTYYKLREDMYEFNFTKPNGDVNQNRFYNTLISSYYKKTIYRKQEIYSYLFDELRIHIKDKNKISKIAYTLNTKLNQLYHSDFNYKYHDYEIYIYPTKETISLYEDIENNELKNESMSEFIRNLFNEYLKSSSIERESLLCSKNLKKIQTAIINRQMILLKNTRDTEILFQPYTIIPSREETFNYIVGKNITNQTNTNFSIKLSRIKSVTILDEYFSFNQKDIENLKYQLLDGPEFLCEETKHIVVKFTKDGIKKYDSCYKDRPLPTKYNDSTGVYVFDTNINKLYLYLLQFGKHVKIIEPIELKNKLNNFHKLAINEDE